VLEKDARNFSWKEHRTNISILEKIGLERELMGKVARMKPLCIVDETIQYFGHLYQRKCRKFGTDSLGGQ